MSRCLRSAAVTLLMSGCWSNVDTCILERGFFTVCSDAGMCGIYVWYVYRFTDLSGKGDKGTVKGVHPKIIKVVRHHLLTHNHSNTHQHTKKPQHANTQSLLKTAH